MIVHGPGSGIRGINASTWQGGRRVLTRLVIVHGNYIDNVYGQLDRGFATRCRCEKNFIGVKWMQTQWAKL